MPHISESSDIVSYEASLGHPTPFDSELNDQDVNDLRGFNPATFLEEVADPHSSHSERLKMINPGDFCILVAEGNAIIRVGITDSLLRRGFRVIEAHNEAEATRLADEYNGLIHVLVTDVELPELDNAGKLKQGRPDLQVLIVSSYRKEDFSPRCSHDALLEKPVGPSRVLSTIEKMLHFDAAQ